MKLKNEWINTLLIILPLSLCVFIVVDIAYNERIWELATVTKIIRLQSLGITIAYFYLMNYIFRRLAHFFIDKSKNEKKAGWKEYACVSHQLRSSEYNASVYYVLYNDGRLFQMEGSGIDQCDWNSSCVSILYDHT